MRQLRWPTVSLVSLGGLVVSAQLALAGESCLPEESRIPAEQVSSVKTDPASLLKSFPSGGVLLTRRVRSLVSTDADLADIILSLVAEASDAQKSAIGTGLSQAAQVCIRNEKPAFARQVQEEVAKLGDDAVFKAFVAAANAVETAAIEGGNAGIGGAVGGGSQNGGANFGNPGGGSSSVPNGVYQFSAAGGGGSSVSVVRNVSPTR